MARSSQAGILTFVLAAGLAVQCPGQQGERPVRSTSSSGQFVVYSIDPEWRTAASRRADEARREWIKWMGDSGDWTHPIIVQDLRRSARPAGNPRAVTAIFEADGGALKVQTDIYDASVLAGEAYETEIFRALGLEQIYRKKPLKAGKPFRQIPSWMSEGMGEDLRVERNGTPDGVYAALLRSDRPPRLDEFLKAKPELMEATSLALYRTQALALLKALRQQPEGGAGLAAYVESLDDGDGGIKAILAGFPSLKGDPAQLAKIWTLAIARGSTPHRLDPLSIPETSRALDAILDIAGPVDPKNPEAGMVRGPAALPAIARGNGGAFLMRQKAAEFLSLEYRAHPVMRPVITEYRMIASVLADKPKKNVANRIEENQKITLLLQKKTDNVADYLNWFEATQIDTLSDGVLNISEPPSVPRRTDPLTQHLDAIEQRGW